MLSRSAAASPIALTLTVSHTSRLNDAPNSQVPVPGHPSQRGPTTLSGYRFFAAPGLFLLTVFLAAFALAARAARALMRFLANLARVSADIGRRFLATFFGALAVLLVLRTAVGGIL